MRPQWYDNASYGGLSESDAVCTRHLISFDSFPGRSVTRRICPFESRLLELYLNWRLNMMLMSLEEEETHNRGIQNSAKRHRSRRGEGRSMDIDRGHSATHQWFNAKVSPSHALF
jgi:hypothetical protein